MCAAGSGVPLEKNSVQIRSQKQSPVEINPRVTMPAAINELFVFFTTFNAGITPDEKADGSRVVSMLRSPEKIPNLSNRIREAC